MGLSRINKSGTGLSCRVAKHTVSASKMYIQLLMVSRFKQLFHLQLYLHQ